MKNVNIEKIFPIYAVEQDLLISKKGDISIVYELKLPELYSLDKHGIGRINDLFDRFIRSLPEGTIVQKQDFFFVDKIKENVTDTESVLSRSDNQFFYEKPKLTHSCYLIITNDAKSKASISKGGDVLKKHLTDVDQFLKRVHSSMSFLIKEDFFAIQRLKNDQLIELVGKYFSLSPEPTDVLQDIFVDKQLKVGSKTGEIYSLMSNEQLPIQMNSTTKNTDFSTAKTDFQIPFIQPISIGLECNHIYNQVIFIDRSEKIFSKLKTKLNQFKSLAILSKENEIIHDQIEELVENAIEDELLFIKQHYSLIVWNDREAKLEHDRTQTENAFRRLGMSPYHVKYAVKDVFFYNCPGAAGFVPEEFKFIGVSKHATLLLNFESYYDTNKDGIVLCDRKNYAPLRLDLWDEPLKRGLIVNRNRLIFGPSGTGKSFLVNHIASQYYEQGHHIVMIDIGNSYKKLCHLVNGAYYSYEVSAPLQFNPFFIREKTINVDKKEFLVSLILFLWKGYDPYKREEKQIIALYIDAYYKYLGQHSEIKPSMSTFYEFVIANEVLDHEANYFDKDSFKLSIRDFHDGKYGQVLNAEEPVDLLSERFIVFEMDNIKDHPVLFPLVTMLCIDLIMEKIRRLPDVKKSIFIDECWKPISKGDMAEFIKYLYKTVRKFYGEVAIATQDIEDILETVAGPAMINNTDTMILLSHKKKMASKDKFAQHLSFSESDLEKLFSTNKREVFVKVGSKSNVYKVNVSPERYACYTSNADENKLIYGMYNEHKNMKLAINEFVEKRVS